MGRTIKFFTKKSLRRANDRAIRMNLNRQVKRSYIKSLHDDTKYPITMELFHDGYDGKPDTMRYVVVTGDLSDIGGTVTNIHIDVPLNFISKDVFEGQVQFDG